VVARVRPVAARAAAIAVVAVALLAATLTICLLDIRYVASVAIPSAVAVVGRSVGWKRLAILAAGLGVVAGVVGLFALLSSDHRNAPAAVASPQVSIRYSGLVDAAGRGFGTRSDAVHHEGWPLGVRTAGGGATAPRS
jgi:hypothetical protein